MTDDQLPANLPPSEMEFRARVTAALLAGEKRMDSLDAGIRANTQLTEEIKADTREFLEVFRAVKGGFKVLGWIGTFLKGLSGLAIAVGAIYAAMQAALTGFKHLLK